MKTVWLAAVLLFVAPLAAAQAPDAALVREMLTISGAEKQYEQMQSMMLESMRAGFSRGFADAARGKAIDPAKRDKAQAIADRHMQALMQDFSAEMRRAMPFNRLVEEIYVPLYQRNFTRDELSAMVAFLKSPAGRKFIDATPRLMQESVQIVNQRFTPQLIQSMSKLGEQRMRQMVEELKGI